MSSPPAKGVKKEGGGSGGGKTGAGVVTGSLRINVSGLQSDKPGSIQTGTEVDIPYIEDTSATKPKVEMIYQKYFVKFKKLIHKNISQPFKII